MNVAVVRKIGLVGLLDPQRDGLRNQCLELDIIRCRHTVDHEQVIPTDTRLPEHAMRDQDVTTKRCIELEKPFLLNQPSRECPDHAVRIHSASLRIMLFSTGDSTNDDSVTSIGWNSNN